MYLYQTACNNSYMVSLCMSTLHLISLRLKKKITEDILKTRDFRKSFDHVSTRMWYSTGSNMSSVASKTVTENDSVELYCS